MYIMINILRLTFFFFAINGYNSFIGNIGAHINLMRNSLSMKANKDTPDTKSLSQYYQPKTINQEKYVNYLNDYKTKILFVVGPAGTGKTLFACNTAIRELKNGNINKIVLTRPVVPVEEDIGFLPGNINRKMDPWTRPIFDVFLEFFSQRDIDMMIQNNVIEISPLAYMRGRTFKKAFIIADEMQNSSPNQMLMLTTRIGEGSKMVITGDLHQSDRSNNNGLSDFMNKYNLHSQYLEYKYNLSVVEFNKNLSASISNISNITSNSSHISYVPYNKSIRLVELTNADIERSKVVVDILEVYNITEEKVNNVKLLLRRVPNLIPSVNKTTPSKPMPTTELFMSSPFYSDAALIPIHHMSNRSRTRKLPWE